ncbi:Ank1 [Symbiodinium sp. CCMP2592]|nr:Ank1 [Symbiodinium sp. CCMP2592]
MSQEPKDSKESTKSSKSKSKENKEAEASVDEQAGAAPDDQFIGKFHSALRWGKAEDEVQALVTDASVSRRSAARAPDPKTGNQALHIAVQNGHRELTQLLIAWKADVTAQNFKGQTPLHMSVEYDFYFISKLLLEKGAKKEVENSDGCQAILGISGSKEGAEAWDAPINILKNAANKEEIELAYKALEGAVQHSETSIRLSADGSERERDGCGFCRKDPTSLDKASLARIGMLKAGGLGNSDQLRSGENDPPKSREGKGNAGRLGQGEICRASQQGLSELLSQSSCSAVPVPSWRCDKPGPVFQECAAICGQSPGPKTAQCGAIWGHLNRRLLAFMWLFDCDCDLQSHQHELKSAVHKLCRMVVPLPGTKQDLASLAGQRASSTGSEFCSILYLRRFGSQPAGKKEPRHCCSLVFGESAVMARTKLATVCVVLAFCTALRNLAFVGAPAPAPETPSQLRGTAIEAASATVPAILLTPAAASAADGEGVLGVGVLCALAAFSVVSSVISATVTSELD